MKEKYYSFSLILLLLLLITLTGCDRQEELLWEYKPMISKGDDLFGDTGHTQKMLSDEWELIGVIEEAVSRTEPMVTGQTYYIANELPVGTEIYGREEGPDVIYAKYEDTYIRYELMEE